MSGVWGVGMGMGMGTGGVGFSCGVGLVRLWGVGGMGDVGRGLMMFYYPWLWNRFVVGIAAGVVLHDISTKSKCTIMSPIHSLFRG